MSLLSDPIPDEPEVSQDSQDTAPQDDGVVDAAPEPQGPPPTVEATLSRSQRARQTRQERDQLKDQLSQFQQSLQDRERQWQEDIAKRDAELARLRGAYEAITPIIQQQRQQATPQGPTPEQLYAEAQKALDGNDFATYQRKFAEAVKLETLAAIPKPQAQQQSQVDPRVMILMAQYPAAARNMNMVQAYDQLLGAQGVADGPDRWEQAFKLAAEKQGGASKLAAGPRFGTDDKSKALLTGNGPGAGSAPRTKQPGDRRIKGLPANWKHIAQMGDVPEAEFLRHWAETHPESVDE